MASSSEEAKSDAVEDGPTWQRQIGEDGTFQRRDAAFRRFIEARPDAEFAAESGRYHLYVSLACPWAHRALIMRRLKGLDDAISYNVVDWFLPHDGWTLEAKTEGATLDTVNGERSLRGIYRRVEPGYRGSVTVPTLWDKKKSTIVNNESSEIIRMFNSEFNEFSSRPEYDFYPADLRAKIDEVNEWIYPHINNGVYRAGFARSQKAYEIAVTDLFESLERAERILENSRYLTGGRLTEADIRLWTTLIRFDVVYVTHFKCNLKRLVDFPHLWGFTRELYAHPAFRETTSITHIKRHYFESHESINPYRIVPLGPEVDYNAPHGRDHLSAEWFPDPS